MSAGPKDEPANRLSWINFHETYVAAGAPARIRMLDRPGTELLVEPVPGRITLRIAAAKEEPLPAELPQFIIARFSLLRGKRYLEVITERHNLFRPFYFFVLSIIDHLAAGLGPKQALFEALAENRALLQQDTFLSEEAMLGLFGELWVLRRLVQLHGPVAVDAWTGPRKLPHDFRFGDCELEVKTTRNVERIHRIHGVGQLTASADATLYVVSIMAEPTGPAAGDTVPELVADIVALLSQSVERTRQFRKNLADCGYFDADAEKYDVRLVLRDHPTLIPVDAVFPSITASKLNNMLGDSSALRVSRVEYSVNVQGMGRRIDSSESQKILEQGF